jgi:hypothetical protein
MGVKVEGVRADERVVVADTTARNRKMLIGGAIFVVIVVVAAVVVVQALKPVPTYGPAGHEFQASFGGGAVQSSTAQQVGSFRAASGVTGVESWRFASASVAEVVQIENFPTNDPFLIEGADATNLLIQELPGSHAVTISGLPGVELLSTTSYATGYTANFPYTDQAILLQGDTQFVITAAGNSRSDVTSFVHSFKTVG